MFFTYVGGGKELSSGYKFKATHEIDESVNPFSIDLTKQNTSIVHQIKKTDFNKHIVQLTKHSLISIISGLSQTNFNHSTLGVAINDIRSYKAAYIDTVPDSKLFIDSGGYSIITGTVSPMDINRFIYYYNYYLENERQVFDYMFSLDIPIFLAYPQYNTKDAIYNFNKQSLSESRKLLEQYPELRDKFYFIYQFKVDGQYEIWNKLYHELELKKYIRNWAIGGMVGLRGILRKDPNSTDINFSPFTALAYKSFYDYINSDNVNGDFKLHNLGVYIKYDRFHLTLLEKLFTLYRYSLDSKTCSSNIKLTYDSVNYMRTAQLKVRDLLVYQFDDVNQYLLVHPNIQTLKTEILKIIYNDDESYTDMMIEMNNLQNGNMLHNIDAFTPINVYSNKQLDAFFDYLITKYQIAELFFNSNNWETLNRILNNILLTISAQYPDLFNSKLMTCVKENFRITYIFHHWYMTNRTEEKLNSLVNAFVAKIGFPAKLG